MSSFSTERIVTFCQYNIKELSFYKNSKNTNLKNRKYKEKLDVRLTVTSANVFSI